MDAASGMMMVYGLFSAVGGLIGYFKAKSRVSLVAGLISGFILLTCGTLAAHNSSLHPLSVGTVVALLLGGRFFRTWLVSRRVMPDAVMILLSFLTVVLNTMRLLGK